MGLFEGEETEIVGELDGVTDIVDVGVGVAVGIAVCLLAFIAIGFVNNNKLLVILFCLEKTVVKYIIITETIMKDIEDIIVIYQLHNWQLPDVKQLRL